MSASTKRKHVTLEQICGDPCPPNEDESIVRLVEGRGHNLHLVNNVKGEEFLVSMPSKFRRSIWVKRGDFMLIKSISEGVKVKGEITRIINANYVKYLKDLGLWPDEFSSNDLDENPFEGGNPNNRGEPEGASHSETSSDESE